MAGPLMQQQRVDMVVVGADRIAANGDVANKIGTYTVAIEATTFSGDVRSDFPLTLQSTPGTSLAPGRRNRAIRGSFGDAGATLILQSFSGDIVIVRR
jgi:hypothetical protein